MRLLLDANVVIWMLTNPERLSRNVLSIIANRQNPAFVSTASLLEIVTKAASGRLHFTDAMYAALELDCDWLSVSAQHVLHVRGLPPIHKDPFDRIIVAQAMLENMTLVTGDRLLLDYGVPIILT